MGKYGMAWGVKIVEESGMALYVRTCWCCDGFWFVRSNTSIFASKSQELRLFGKVIKTSWRETVADLLTHFPTVWH